MFRDTQTRFSITDEDIFVSPKRSWHWWDYFQFIMYRVVKKLLWHPVKGGLFPCRLKIRKKISLLPDLMRRVYTTIDQVEIFTKIHHAIMAAIRPHFLSKRKMDAARFKFLCKVPQASQTLTWVLKNEKLWPPLSWD